jgi:glycosyltransferase involved in cell wall biosynthesis
VVVNSRFTLDVLTEVAPSLRERSTVVHNAVRGPACPTAAREEVTTPLRLAFVGRLSPRKGPQVALAVLAELLARGVDARLDLLGSVFPGYEWFEAELREQVRTQGLTGRVAFRGFQPDVWPGLAAADVVLVPSVGEESFGNTAVEAVLAARPVVVSDSSGLREAVAGLPSARVAAPGDVMAWADAVTAVLADWSRVRAQALADAAQARLRYGAGRYRAGLHEALAGPAGGPVRPSSRVGTVAGRGRDA